MKRCPKCQLVHSDADYVCRRCGVDLATGEPRLRETRKVVPQKSLDQIFREKIRSAQTVFQKPFARLNLLKAKILAKIPPSKLIAPEARQIENLIYCLQCGGEMKPATRPFYPRKMLYPFLGLSLLFFGLAFLFPFLIITGVLSLASFIFYLRLREELWLCNECGSYHKRIKKKKSKASAGSGY